MRRTIILACAISLFAVLLSAQTLQGTIKGQVRDIAGAVIVGATVVATGPSDERRTAVTNESGEFVVDDLPPGTYSVVISGSGFDPFENRAVDVESGETTALSITLSVATLETEVIVTDLQTVDTAPEANAGAIVLNEQDIEALPDDEEELQAALQALAGPGAGPNGGGIYIDGFSGGSLPPRDTIREIRINSNPFSSEYDRLGFGRVEIFTKPGTDRYRGEAEIEFEDEALNSRNPFVPERAPYQRREIELQFGGPLIKEKASFFLNFEHENSKSNSIVNALVLDPGLNPQPFQRSVVTPSDGIEFDPRVDFQINENNTLVARYSFERGNSENAGLGGFDLPSRAFDNSDSEHVVRLTETAVLSPKVINEMRFQYIRRRDTRTGLDNSPTIRVNDAFTSGGSNVGSAFSEENRFEFQNYASFIFSNHSLKVGTRIRHLDLLESSPNNFAGTFTFTSLDQYRSALMGSALPAQFAISGGDPQADVSQSDVGLFVQDDWRIDPQLTLSLGLRYENQTNLNGDHNFAPRLGIAYAPGASGQNSPKTVLRAGFGIFYDRLGENLTLQARRFNGTNQQRYIVTDPAILGNVIFTPTGVTNVPTVDQLSAFAQPQTTRSIAADIRTPYTSQFAFSVERQLPLDTTFSATYLYARTERSLRSRNINAPRNGIRPFPDEGNIFQYESTGKFRQNQLLFNVRTRIKDVSIFANYSLNKAESDTDGAGSFPVDQYDLTGEFGRAAIDSRHRFVVGSNFTAPWDIRIRPFIVFRSGSPFNITTGTDTNGDTLFNERPTFAELFARCDEIGLTTSFCDRAGIADPGQPLPRNYATGPEFFNVNLRMSKAFQFGTRGGGDSSGGGGRRGGRFGGPFGVGRGRQGGNEEEGRFSVEFTVQVRNLFNRANLGSPVGNLRSPFFGRSISTAGGFGFGGGSSAAGNRRVELELQFEF
ncbi:MAG: TonB-dependent receptor [Pyrinomonadaceae bacterium]